MSRLQKKCLVVSGGTHVFLLFIVLVGAAFFVPEKEEPLPSQPLNMIPSKLIDDALAGGGGNPELPKKEEKQKGETYKPEEPKPKPPEEQPEPKKVEPKKVEPKKAEPKKEVKKAEPRRTKPKPVEKPKKPVSRLGDLKRRTLTKPPTTSRRSAFSSEVAKAAKTLSSGFEKGTEVEVSGTGGAAYANYASLVRARYDDAWEMSAGVAGVKKPAKVRVKIARSGDVISAVFIEASGDSKLDASVKRALTKVNFIAPFPKGTTDKTKTFIIHFETNGRQATG